MLSLPFDRVRIGSVVMKDGSISTNTEAFNLARLGNYLKIVDTQSGYTQVSGSSTYSSRASSHYGSLSVAGTYGVPFVSSVKASLDTSYGQASASDSTTVSLEAYSFGTNAACEIQWSLLSPSLLIACLTASMQADGSDLLNVLRCSSQVLDLLKQPGTDLNQPSQELKAKAKQLFDAKARFRDQYGVGFISGVQIGGAAYVKGQFDKSSQSSNSQFDIKATVSKAGVEGAMSIGSAYGQTTKEALRQARFTAISEYTGGAAYQAFADQYRKQFDGQMGKDVWDKDFAKAPDIPKSEPVHMPETVKPKDEKNSNTAANPLGDNTTTTALDDASRISLNASNSDGSVSATDQQELNEQAIKDLNKAVAKDNVSSADFKSNRASAPLPDRSQALLKSSSGGLRSAAPGQKGMPTAAASPGAPSGSSSSDAVDNNNYWQSILQGNAVVGVTVTRWEDVLPGFSLDSPFDDQKQINQLNRLLAFITAANESLNISRMFAMAAIFNPDSEQDWKAKGEIFCQFSDQLRLAAGKDDPSSLADFVDANLQEEEDRKIFDFYREYDWLFEANRVGMGGYMEFPKDNSYNEDGTYYLVGAGDRQSTATAGGKYVWFTPKLTSIGTNKPGKSQVGVSTRYSDSIKFYPVLALDCSGFHLMAAEPSWGTYGFYMNGFFGNEGAYLKLFPFSCIKKADCSGKTEAVLTFPDPVELFKLKDYSLYTIGFKDKHAPATAELLPKIWLSHNSRQPVKLHMVPFAVTELSSVQAWKGFILSTPNLAPDVSVQMQSLQTALIDNRGINYWTKTAGNGTIPPFTKYYDPKTMADLTWKWGLANFVSNGKADR